MDQVGPGGVGGWGWWWKDLISKKGYSRSPSYHVCTINVKEKEEKNTIPRLVTLRFPCIN